MRVFAALLLLTLPTASAAPVPKELKKDTRDDITGTWVQTASCNGGGNIAPATGIQWKFDAEGRASILRSNAPPAEGIRYALDASGDPKTFDWVAKWGAWYGVYELQGDRLTIYLSPAKADRADHGRNLRLGTGPGVEMYSFQRADTSK